MTSSSTPSSATDAMAATLQKSQSAVEEVKTAADELAVVHSVLETKLPDAKGDVEAAIARTGEVADKLDQVTQKLEEVTEALAEQAKAS